MDFTKSLLKSVLSDCCLCKDQKHYIHNAHSYLHLSKTNSDVHVQAESLLLPRLFLNRTKWMCTAHRCRRHRSSAEYQATELWKQLLFILPIVNDFCFPHLSLCTERFFISSLCDSNLWHLNFSSHFALHTSKQKPT